MIEQHRDNVMPDSSKHSPMHIRIKKWYKWRLFMVLKFNFNGIIITNTHLCTADNDKDE